MKYLKWAALILVVLAIVAAVVMQWRRDSIALEIANRVLKDTDFVVASVSVRTLGVDHIELSSIVLETPSGTRYDVAGVDFPLTARGPGPRRIDIQSMTMTWGDGTARATSYTQLARTFLALPATLENTDVHVERVSIQALPELSAISWTTAGRGQTFAAEVAGLAVRAAVTEPADTIYEVRLAVSDAAGSNALQGTLSFAEGEQRIGIDGDVRVDVAAIGPLLRELAWLPDSAESIAATLAGPVAVDLDAEGDGSLAVRFEPIIASGGSLSWRNEDDSRIVVRLGADTRADIAFAYPSMLWSLYVEELRGTLVHGDGKPLPATLSGVGARAGASGWTADVGRVEVAVDELRPVPGLLAAIRPVISDVEIRDGLSSITAKFRSSPGAGQLRYGDFALAVPGAEGTIRRAGDVLAVSLRLFDKARSLSAIIDFDHDFASARGSARIRDGVIDFGRRKLSQHLAHWPHSWDVIAGTWSVTANVDWATASAGLQYRGESTHRIAGLAGLYNDIGLAGLATTLQADIGSAAPLAIRPATIDVELIDVGVAVNNVTARVIPDVANLGATVKALSGKVLGGGFTIDPFTYSFGAERNDLRVRLERVQPQFMLDLAEFEQLKVTGTMSGMLPVTLVENTVRIEGGSMSNDPPGGVIRYKGGEAGSGSNEQLAMVTGALSNFVYDSLTAKVDYTEAGDLRLGMRLEGINPDRDPTQPIILNLNVENNIPEMLRSLQAVRSIEDILERRAAN